MFAAIGLEHRPSSVWTPLADNALPFAGLATSLPTEYDYVPRVEGRLPPALQGTLYRNGPGLFDRGGGRKRMLLDGDGMIQAYQFRNSHTYLFLCLISFP